MLIALAFAGFLLSAAGISLSPFLQTLADDLSTDLATVANLLSFMAISWAISSLIAGAASDRIGRRPILVGAVVIAAAGQFGFAAAPTYPLALIALLLAGVGGGAFTGTVYSAVADHVPPQQRGRALGWIIVGQSLALVLGVPIIALLGALGGWRSAITIYAVAIVVSALAVRLALPIDPLRSPSTNQRQATALTELARPTILLLLSAGIAERTCFACVAVYMATYLQISYGVSLTAVAFSLSLIALGTVTGNMLGGRLADRFHARTLLFAGSALATALLALPLMLWQPSLAISVGLGFCYSFTNALGRPALLASLSEVPHEVRGAVLGVNVTASSVGWLTAAALGGWLLTRYSFTALGILCSLAALTGAFLGVCHWRLWKAQRLYDL